MPPFRAVCSHFSDLEPFQWFMQPILNDAFWIFGEGPMDFAQCRLQMLLFYFSILFFNFCVFFVVVLLLFFWVPSSVDNPCLYLRQRCLPSLSFAAPMAFGLSPAQWRWRCSRPITPQTMTTMCNALFAWTMAERATLFCNWAIEVGIGGESQDNVFLVNRQMRR